MAVPYQFANIPNGQTIPLAQLDANFAYIENQIGGSTGVLAITSGGTGATTPQGALVNLLPAQMGNAGKFLTTDGNGNVTWAVTGGGSSGVSSFSGGSTGLTPSVATTGVITLAGTLSIANGGTGGNSANAAINNLLPSQAGNSGRYLQTDGNNVSWVAGGAPGSGTVTSVAVSGGTTGLTTSGSPVTTAGTITLGGTLAPANGGTGNSALPSNGQLLIGNGSGYTLGTITAGSNITITNTAGGITIAASGGGGGGGVTSVGLSGGTTGLIVSGSPVTTSGTMTLSGTLAVANGGTGATTQAAALNNLLPSQTGAANKVLTTNGSGTVTWATGGNITTGSYGDINVTATVPGAGAWTINPGVVTPSKLSTGGPTWTAGGSVTVSNLIVNSAGTANITLNSGVNFGVYSSGTSFVAMATPSGNVGFLSNTAGAGFTSTGPYTNSSDATLKRDVSVIGSCMNMVKQLNGVYFTWNNDETNARNVGLIAQDVQQVVPEVVSVSAYDGKLGIAYASLVPILINAVKELEARVAALEAK